MRYSIIIPAYNAEEYIRDCLKSIIRSNCKDFEVIIVVNGSNDNTYDICQSFAKDNNELDIKVFNLEEGSLPKSRNFGMKQANGDYIWFVDSDDTIAFGAIDIINAKIEQYNNPDMLIFSYNTVKDGETKPFETNFEECAIDSKKVMHGLFEANAWNGYVWNKIYKKEKIDSLSFEPKFDGIEDLRFNVSVCKNITASAVIPDKLYNYKILSNSASHKIIKNDQERMFMLYGELLKEISCEEYPFEYRVLKNACVDFARGRLNILWNIDKKEYYKKRKRLKKVITENFKYIKGAKAKLISVVPILSPRLDNILRKMTKKEVLK
ncbi:MAG: glycosyltransferase [Clostridia bacterium]|nr:glycosyltransferase [Clostridia bacterium]